MIGLAKTHTDITINKQFEKKPSQLRSYLSNIINSMPSVIIRVDKNFVVIHEIIRQKKDTNSKRGCLGKTFKRCPSQNKGASGSCAESIDTKKVKTISRKQSNIQEEIFYENIIVYPPSGGDG